MQYVDRMSHFISFVYVTVAPTPFEAGLTRTDGKKTVWSPAIEVTQSDGTY
jgi:hypothetical protein